MVAYGELWAMEIKLTIPMAIFDNDKGRPVVYGVGATVKMPEREAKRMVALGRATLVTPQKKTVTESAPPRRGRKPKTE